MINVTKTFLPPLEEYQEYLAKIWQNGQFTNNGPYLKELESKLLSYLQVPHFQFVTNGTIALQLAIEALDIKSGEIITTPYSYVATTSSILWQNCQAVFVDIEEDNFTIDADKIEAKITPQTKAIMAVHVFGYACNIEKIEALAKKYQLKVIYDAAHCFGAKYKGRSLCAYGDIATLSFHATKLFHTVEGGACIVQDPEVNKKLDLAKRFGHHLDDHYQLGINGKNSELHAAMGLSNFKYIEHIIAERKKIVELYDELLINKIQRPKAQKDLSYNYAYYPVLLENEAKLLEVMQKLQKEDINARRYFYPALNTLNYLEQKQACPLAENIALRSLCLPLYVGLEEEYVYKIAKIVGE